MTDRTTTHRNEILLVGEVSAAPTSRPVADGSEITTFRVRVDRADEAGADDVDCTVRSGRAQRTVAAWQPGDVVQVTGTLRRRFYKNGSGSRPFTVVEVEQARRVGGAVSSGRRTRG